MPLSYADAMAWSWILGATLGLALVPGMQTQAPAPPGLNSPVAQAIGVQSELKQLARFEREGAGQSNKALALRNRILQKVLLTSFDVDETLARIDAEAAHANESRSVLDAEKERRDTALNTAAFVLGGTLGTTGSAMQLTRGLAHAGNALNIAGGVAAVSLSVVQLSLRGHKRLFLSPYNMLAEVLDQNPNAQSHYPTAVAAYLRAPFVPDGQLPDAVPPQESLRRAWYRLHRLQGDRKSGGASILSATTDSTQGLKLTPEELTDREAMLRDLHGTVALLKTDLRNILLALESDSESPSFESPSPEPRKEP